MDGRSMSPISIPGTAIQIPYKTQKTSCRSCGRKYHAPQVKRVGNSVTLHCPYCGYKIKTISYRELEGEHLTKIQLTSNAVTITPLPLVERNKIKIFISYVREDYLKAEEIYENFVARGYTVWMDKKSLLPGQEWKREIERAIKTSDYFLACLSNCSVTKRGFYQKEIRYALDVLTTIPFGQIYLIPVRLEQCEVPDDLQHIQWIDLDSFDVYQKLFQALEHK